MVQPPDERSYSLMKLLNNKDFDLKILWCIIMKPLIIFPCNKDIISVTTPDVDVEYGNYESDGTFKYGSDDVDVHTLSVDVDVPFQINGCRAFETQGNDIYIKLADNPEGSFIYVIWILNEDTWEFKCERLDTSLSNVTGESLFATGLMIFNDNTDDDIFKGEIKSYYHQRPLKQITFGFKDKTYSDDMIGFGGNMFSNDMIVFQENTTTGVQKHGSIEMKSLKLVSNDNIIHDVRVEYVGNSYVLTLDGIAITGADPKPEPVNPRVGHIFFEINETDSATQPQRIDIFMDLWYGTSDEPIGMGTNENKGVSYMEFIFNNFTVDSIKKEFADEDSEWSAPQKFTNIGVVFDSNGIDATMFPLLKTDGPMKVLSLTGKYNDNMSKEDVSLDLTQSKFRATAIIYDYDDYADKTKTFQDGDIITGANGATTERKVLFTHKAVNSNVSRLNNNLNTDVNTIDFQRAKKNNGLHIADMVTNDWGLKSIPAYDATEIEAKNKLVKTGFDIKLSLKSVQVVDGKVEINVIYTSKSLLEYYLDYNVVSKSTKDGDTNYTIADVINADGAKSQIVETTEANTLYDVQLSFPYDEDSFNDGFYVYIGHFHKQEDGEWNAKKSVDLRTFIISPLINNDSPKIPSSPTMTMTMTETPTMTMTMTETFTETPTMTMTMTETFTETPTMTMTETVSITPTYDLFNLETVNTIGRLIFIHEKDKDNTPSRVNTFFNIINSGFNSSVLTIENAYDYGNVEYDGNV